MKMPIGLEMTMTIKQRCILISKFQLIDDGSFWFVSRATPVELLFLSKLIPGLLDKDELEKLKQDKAAGISGKRVGAKVDARFNPSCLVLA